MSSLSCLWNRSRLEPYTDGALAARAARAVTAHVERCPDCRTRVERLRRLRDFVSVEAGPADDPDWAGFWPAVRQRIAERAGCDIRRVEELIDLLVAVRVVRSEGR